MAETIIIEAVTGIAVEGGCKKLLRAIKTVIKFNSILENLRATVVSWSRNINRIAQLEVSEELQDQIRKLLLLLEQAEELIDKCSRIAWWNYFKKCTYSKKLIELDASLHRASIGLLPAVWENILRIQDEITELNQRLERIMHERNAHGGILKRSKTKALYVAGVMKKIVQSIPIWIHPYLSWILRIPKPGCRYRRISSCYRPNNFKDL